MTSHLIQHQPYGFNLGFVHLCICALLKIGKESKKEKKEKKRAFCCRDSWSQLPSPPGFKLSNFNLASLSSPKIHPSPWPLSSILGFLPLNPVRILSSTELFCWSHCRITAKGACSEETRRKSGKGKEDGKMITEKPNWVRHEGMQIFSIDIQTGSLRFATGGGDHKVSSCFSRVSLIFHLFIFQWFLLPTYYCFVIHSFVMGNWSFD